MDNIPDYNKELERIDSGGDNNWFNSVTEFLYEILNVHIDPLLLKVIMYLILFLICCFIAWLVVKEYKVANTAIKGKDTNTNIVSAIDSAKDADYRGHDFDRELSQALSVGDYALAVELLYLKTLSILNSQKRIKWRDYKTPLIYVDELASGKEELNRLTLTFLYIKYGHYPALESTYQEAKHLHTQVTSFPQTEKGGGRQ